MTQPDEPLPTPEQLADELVMSFARDVELRYNDGRMLARMVECAIERAREDVKRLPERAACAKCGKPATCWGQISYSCQECIPRV